jgi:hypothetical protein
MRKRPPSSRSLRAQGLRKVTVVVPEGCAEGIRQFALELLTRPRAGSAVGQAGWRTLSPSAGLLVNPECGARCAVRDTGADGEKRFHWTVTILGRSRAVAAGRTGESAEARSLAEAALSAYVVDSREGATQVDEDD